jgi:hypothetical protein
MTPLAATHAAEVAIALGAGLLSSALAVIGLLLTRVRQRSHLKSLATATVDPAAMDQAAARAETEEQAFLREVLQGAVADVAADQRLAEGLVRGALYGLNEGQSVRVLEGETINFDPAEIERIDKGTGELGVSEVFKGGHPIVTVFGSAEENSLEEQELGESLDPALRWRIAVPVFGSGQEPIWVMGLDGLVEGRTSEELRSSVSHLLYYREVLELFLKTLATKRR